MVDNIRESNERHVIFGTLLVLGRFWIELECVAMPSLIVVRCCHLANATELLTSVVWTMAGGWVRTQVLLLADQIKFACASVSVVCNAVFRFTMSCCVPETLAIKSRSFPKSRRIFTFLDVQISGETSPKFQTEFHKSGSLSNMW